ncbi:MAG: hypothetical protein AAGH40_01025 [Verrucomicrobiota bacterium]
MSKTSRARVYLTVVAMITITMCSAFMILWAQQQISRSAQRSQGLEARLAETMRKLRYLDERIAAIHQPVVLQGRVAGSLRPSVDEQIVWVQERKLPTGRAYAVSDPYVASIDLAFVELDSD